MKPEIEESKIIEMIRSFEDGRALQVQALALANARTEEQMKNAIDRLTEFNVTLTDGLSNISQDIKNLDVKLSAKIKEGDDKFASKLVEKIVYTTCAAFGLAIIGALIVLVLPNKANAAALFLFNLTS